LLRHFEAIKETVQVVTAFGSQTILNFQKFLEYRVSLLTILVYYICAILQVTVVKCY